MALRYYGLLLLTTEDPLAESETIATSGDNIQRWLLKTLLTHTAAKVFTSGGTPVIHPNNSAYIRLLFGQAAWPEMTGLYISQALSAPMTLESLSIIRDIRPLVLNNGELCGGIVWFGGIAFLISLFRPTENDGGPFDGATHQPAALRFSFGDTTKTIAFTWQNPRPRPVVAYNGQLYPKQ